jgi:hypothetical protein
MDDKPTRQSWWQTVPGILTAAAATITAVTGLIVALQQAGVFDTATAADPPAQNETAGLPVAAEDRAGPASVTPSTSPSVTGRTIQLPDGHSVTMRSASAQYRYTILSAQYEPSPPGKYLLRFRIRLWTDGTGGALFGSSSFRLHAGELHLAPTNYLNELVSWDETKEGDVEFEVDDSITEAIIVITVGGLNFSGNTKQLRVALL